MSGLELVIRPFQSRDITPPKRIFGAEKAVEPVTVSIGSAGGTAFVFSAFSVIQFQTDDRFTYREVERQTTVKRITSDSDPSQNVDVESIDRVLLKNKADPDDKRIYEFKNGS
jgi:hypothetical protein